MLEVLTSVDFWKIAAPLFGAVGAWFVNERHKRVWEQYQRKEDSYRELLRCLKGFYIGASDAKELKLEFLNQLDRCWLYCPDEVILKGYAFLETVHTASESQDEQKEMALGDFVASIRNDLLTRKLVKSTNLTAKQFKILKVN